MVLTPASSTGRPLPVSRLEPPIQAPPPLWSRLDPERQRQLAQHLAELIRRRRITPSRVEEHRDEFC